MTSEIVAFNDSEYRSGDLYRVVAHPFNSDAATVQVHIAGNDILEYVKTGSVVLLVKAFYRNDTAIYAHVMIDNKICEIDIELIEKAEKVDDST